MFYVSPGTDQQVTKKKPKYTGIIFIFFFKFRLLVRARVNTKYFVRIHKFSPQLLFHWTSGKHGSITNKQSEIFCSYFSASANQKAVRSHMIKIIIF